MPRKFSPRGKKKQVRRTYPEIVGKVQMTREGFVFVIPDGATKDEDVYVKAAKTRNALNGDIVRVAVTKEKTDAKARREGEIIEIVERSARPFIGILHFVGSQAWVLMQAKNMPYDIAVDQQQAIEMGGHTGDKVAVKVERWERRDPNPVGRVVDVLGTPGENDTEMHAILAEYNLPYRFEKAVEDAADQISDQITAADLKGRKDFRKTLTFTIDPADAKDFDDALSFRQLENGNYEVGVHIADVTYYVRPDTLVDQEAVARGTSVYLVDRTVPMLPEKLCNKLCSLRPNEDKLTFSAVFELTPKGKIISRWIGRTVICSAYRFDYEGAQQFIEEGEEGLKTEMPGGIKAAILKLWKVAEQLRKRRFAAGAMNFERPEMKVLVDETGRPVDVYEKISKEANWLIEEYMLLANRTVAEYVATNGKFNGVESKKAKTFVYRVHAEPNDIKIASLRQFAGNFGHKMEEASGAKAIAKSLNALLADAKGTPEFDALQMLALRAMAKASYTTDNIGHYGLAFEFYTHFTSPIRRYPDMMVHRLLADYLAGGESASKPFFEDRCRYASERENIAAEAERSSIKYKLVEFMQDKVGNEYDGHISGITEWGMYVEIEPTKVEGMVALRDIKGDFFSFDEEHYRLVGRRTRRVFRLGDPVRIKVKNTNLEQKLLDYELILPEEPKAPKAVRVPRATKAAKKEMPEQVGHDVKEVEHDVKKPADKVKKPVAKRTGRTTRAKKSPAE